MNNIPQKLKEEIYSDSFYEECLRESDGDCSGVITLEHAIVYAGRQVQEKWAIIPLCEYHHLGNGLDKDFNRWCAFIRASEKDMLKYPRLNFAQQKKYLDERYKYEYPEIKDRLSI